MERNISTLSGKKIFNILLGEIDRHLLKNGNHVYTKRQALEQWIYQLNNLPDIKGRVLITALRNETWIEWAVYCAAVIRQMGFESTLLYKAEEVEKFYKGKTYFNFWSGVKKIPGIILIDLNTLPFDNRKYDYYYEVCCSSSIAALAYDYHIESADIIDNPDLYSKELELLRAESATNGARLYNHLTQNKYHQFICYSGIIRDTSMLLQGAIEASHEVVCVEGWSWRPGHMIYNFNAPALEYNIKGWMNHFGSWDKSKEKEISEYFKFLDGNKSHNNWLQNFYSVQLAKISEGMPHFITDFLNGPEKIFLLACNVIGDSSLLNRETFFRSHKEFIKETVEFFKNRNDLKLIIRVHPAEEWVKTKVKIKLGSYSTDLVGVTDNILVIDSSEKLNTFALIPYIHAGLVWVTSAGVDLVVRGKQVITAALPKYYGLGIVNEPKSKKEYFDMIDMLAKTDIGSSVEQITRAKEYLYVVFKGFSYEAQGRDYHATSCRLDKMPSQVEHDNFYRILLKLAPNPDRID